MAVNYYMNMFYLIYRNVGMLINLLAKSLSYRFINAGFLQQKKQSFITINHFFEKSSALLCLIISISLQPHFMFLLILFFLVSFRHLRTFIPSIGDSSTFERGRSTTWQSSEIYINSFQRKWKTPHLKSLFWIKKPLN